MQEFFSEMSGFEKTFWFIAIPSTIILLIQLVMTIIGMDSSDGMDFDDIDGDFDDDGASGHAPFQLFTFRNLVAFFAVMSWTGISLNDAGYSKAATLTWSFVAGIGAMFVMAGIVYLLYKMKSENIPTMDNAVGKKATVYLTIPEKGKGKGKVTVNVNGSSRTVNAYSKGPELSTSSKVEVVGVEGDDLVVDEIK